MRVGAGCEVTYREREQDKCVVRLREPGSAQNIRFDTDAHRLQRLRKNKRSLASEHRLGIQRRLKLRETRGHHSYANAFFQVCEDLA
ncbi:hypothetical protein D3C85_1666820 [compost metagenome]